MTPLRHSLLALSLGALTLGALTLGALTLGALTLGALSLPSPALAQDDGGSDAVAFEAADEAQVENIAGGPLLLAAYAIAWLLIFGYLASLGFRLAGTAREMERLREDVAAAVDAAGAAEPLPAGGAAGGSGGGARDEA